MAKKEKEPRLTFSERAEIRRELLAEYRKHREAGVDHTEAADATREYAKQKFKGSINWAKIIEILMMLLDLFSDEDDD